MVDLVGLFIICSAALRVVPVRVAASRELREEERSSGISGDASSQGT